MTRLSETKNRFLQIAGLCGIITPIVAFLFILSAIATYQPFSWVNNALSDLGVVPGATATLFNFGLIASGVLSFVFAVGLFIAFFKDKVGLVGAFFFIVASGALISIGLFPENIKPAHYLASVAFFVFLPISLLTLIEAFTVKHKARLAAFTLIVALVAALVWILYFTVFHVPGVAIPESVSGLAGTLWVVVLGYKMFTKRKI